MSRLVLLVAGLMLCACATTLPAEPFRAEAFFEHIDLSHPEMREVSRLVASGEFDRALGLWRDLAVRRMRARDFGTYGWHSYKGHGRPKTEAKWYCGRATEAEMKKWRPKRVGKDGLKERIVKGTFEDPFPSMVYLFWETDDAHYLNGAFERMTDFCTTSYPTFWKRYREMVLNDPNMGKRLPKDLPDWRHNVNALHTGWRLKNIMLVAAGFAKCLGEDKAKNWDDVLKPRTGEVSSERLDLIDPVWLAQIAFSGYEHHASQLLWFCDGPGSVPNQRSTGLKGLSMLWLSFPCFKKAPLLGEMIDRSYTEMLLSNFLPDGGSLEQSFNYNREDMKGLEEVANFLEGSGLPFVATMREKAAARRLMNDGLQTPLGSLPQVGNSHHAFGKAFWKDPSWIKRYFDAGGRIEVAPLRPQAYLSKCYPYSGFFAMRDGWDLKSRYLFFMGGRSHTGHSMRDKLSVQITAFGRQLAVIGGPPTYGFRHSPDSEAADTYLSEQSSLKCNTVMVDGKSQAKNQRRHKRAPQTPVASRWHTSERFDLVDGRYSGGYEATGNKDRKKVDMSVSHERVVAFAREAGVWAIVDRLASEGKEAHTYSQVWNFLPYLENQDIRRSAAGFREDQFRLDEKGRVFATADPEGPNVAFHHFGPSAVSYRKYFGHRDPTIGWFARYIGDAVPGPDVHASWTSDRGGLLVTLVAPSDAGQPDPVGSVRSFDTPEKGVAGFEAPLREGGTLTVLASEKLAMLESAGFSSEATLLLIWRRGDAVCGLVRGGATLATPDGGKIGAEGGGFEFWQDDGGQWRTTGIAIPENAEQDPDSTLTPALDMTKFPEGRWPLREPDRTDTKGLEPGLRWKWARRNKWARLYDLMQQADIAPMEGGVCDSLDVTPEDRLGHGHQGALVFEGYLRVPADGIYTFHVSCPDGVRLFIRNPERDFLLPAVAECAYVDDRGAGCAALKAGFHQLRIGCKKSRHSDPVAIEVEGPGVARQALPANWLYRARR